LSSAEFVRLARLRGATIYRAPLKPAGFGDALYFVGNVHAPIPRPLPPSKRRRREKGSIVPLPCSPLLRTGERQSSNEVRGGSGVGV
jgi:hypothetical protein